MNNVSHFSVHNEYREVPLNDVGTNGVFTLLATGIINPFGPTLNALVLDGELDPGSTLPILHLMLNPFSQSATEVGLATLEERWDLMEQIPKFFNLDFGSCPTLLLPSSQLDADEVKELYARFLVTFEDGSFVNDKVRAFPGDPWNRVKQDIGEISAIVKQIQNGDKQELEPRKLSFEDSKQLSATLLKPESIKVELEAFISAWQGALAFQGDSSLANTEMSFEDFIVHFSVIALSCDLPELE